MPKFEVGDPVAFGGLWRLSGRITYVIEREYVIAVDESSLQEVQAPTGHVKRFESEIKHAQEQPDA